MQEFNQIGLKKFVEINFSIEEVSKQLSAWEKYNDTKLKSAASLKDGQDENEGDGSGGDGKNGRGGKSKAPPESSVARAQASVRSKSNNPLVKSEESCLTKRHIAQLHQKNRAINSEVIFTGAVAGNRNNADGSLNNAGGNGNYWSSSVVGTNAYNLNFDSGSVNPANNNNRGNGFSVRCLKDLQKT
jgi:hypothetical protein